MNNSKLTLYTNDGTPYGNLVEAFLKANNIPYDRKIINTMKREGQTPEYLQISPLGKIPAIVEEDGYSLAESGAILKYLCSSRNIKDSLYPKDAKKRGHVDAYYDYLSSVISTLVLIYTKTIIMKETDMIEEVTNQVNGILEKINKNFMKEKKFVASDDEPTIADFTTAFVLEFIIAIVKSTQIPKKLTSYLERANTAFPNIKEQVQSTKQGLISILVAAGAAKAEDFE